MFRYSSKGKLISSSVPIQGLMTISLTDEDVKFFVGFDANGNPIIDKNKFADIEKQKRVNEINTEFERQCSKVGVDFEGNKFQYDDTSRSRLAETKDDIRVRFWRSVDNVNVDMSNEKKNLLYKVLIETYYTKFYEKTQVIDGL